MKTVFWLMMEICLMAISVVLVLSAEGTISMVISLIMAVIIFVSVYFGLFSLNKYMAAFRNGSKNIRRAVESKPNNPWEMIQGEEEFFHHKELDRLFREYTAEVQQQRKFGMILSDIEKVANEERMALVCWDGVMQQIPGTLTGLGILGTFIGLIIGIKNIAFSDVTVAIISIQTLLSGVGIAFYTSMAGVILSILFNIIHKVLWNVTVREMGMFTKDFYRYVIPSQEEQQLFRQKKEIQDILKRMDSMPSKNDLTGISAGQNGFNANQSGNLLKQIQTGLKNGEFVFYLHPSFDLNTKKIIGAEALVRWNHPKMGLLEPSTFMKLIEDNGYITKLDSVIWEQVFVTIRRWIDSGLSIVPITINISKSDILALDIPVFISEMLKKYRIPPMYITIDISERAYIEASSEAVLAEEGLRQHGIKVALDRFDGNYMLLNSIEGIHPDVIKLDLRQMNHNPKLLESTLKQAMQMKMNISATGIENMEQLSILRKGNCYTGIGYYLSKPISIEEFEQELGR